MTGLLAPLRRVGFEFRIEGGRLRFRPVTKPANLADVDDDDWNEVIAAIRERRDLIVAELEAEAGGYF